MNSMSTESLILYIDDNQTRRNNLSSRLRMQGMNVELTGSGFQALHLLERTEYSLILISDHCSDMPPIEIISLIRETKAQKELPIIYIGGQDEISDLKEIIKKGANECALRPDNFQSILDKIQKFL